MTHARTRSDDHRRMAGGHAGRCSDRGRPEAGRHIADLPSRQPAQRLPARGGHGLGHPAVHGGVQQPGAVRPAQAAEQQKEATQHKEYDETLKKVQTILSDKIKEVHLSHRLITSPACLVHDQNALGPQLEKLLKAAGQQIPDVKPILELNPEHISTYALTYEEGTLLTRDLENEVVNKLDEYVELEMYKTAISYLTSNGYNHYEISNFARDGYECAHNHVYWENMSYVGVGAGAYSFIDGVRSSNEKDVFKYIDGINENKNVKSFRENLQPNQFASETVVMSLRLRRGILNADFQERFGYKIEDQFGDQIDRLTKDGLVSYEDERLKITEKGLFVADTVMTEFV